jgi:hypothetical protein
MLGARMPVSVNRAKPSGEVQITLGRLGGGGAIEIEWRIVGGGPTL